jgi:hypothetical protein
MSFTRFYYDECRTKKQLQQSTDPGRWILNVPGNGSKPCYVEDPQIIIQKWGANLRTNTINLESELLGINRPISRDCLGKDNYINFKVYSKEVNYPSCNNLYTEQSRAITPAWMVRDEERNLWGFPVFNPQENVCFSFENNLSTRILEKDYYTPKRDCVVNDINNQLPVSFNLIKGTYVGGPTICSNTNSCDSVKI